MSLTNQQARRILLELYAESHDSSEPRFAVLRAVELSAIWKACQVLEQQIKAENAAVPGKEPPQGQMGKAD